MESVFEIARSNANLTALRQRAIARNIASINQPGYRPFDVNFASSNSSQAPLLATRNDKHIALDNRGMTQPQKAASDKGTNLAEQLELSGENLRRSSLDTAVAKAFNRMVALTLGKSP